MEIAGQVFAPITSADQSKGWWCWHKKVRSGSFRPLIRGEFWANGGRETKGRPMARSWIVGWRS